ncbi:NUDIX hydrolase [Paenirhodobacter populi]|uniref:NUDIX domain-containing protein n=1 Tax=Paenirhodobacter populi TaxID=2306993 RepID=A0A443KIE3_9RHOB|nr:NUDIX hydrolase [Sinirhodobacter populi]RWR05081.1 NUDIX domain-containing protein [Sinirhodobacter populi]RWR32552.1 NUDIX domain-containing protein [Sinirhodobacter populi]
MNIPRLGVLAVTIRGDEVALVQRRNPPAAGTWGFPGGKVEWGETIFEAALRELHEETGLLADPGPVLTSLDALSRDAAGKVAFHYHLIAVGCRWRAGEPLAADDAMAAQWARIEDVLAHRLPQSPAMVEGVDDVLRHALAWTRG